MPRRKKRAAWGSISRVDSDTWRIRYWATDKEGSYRRMSCTVRGTRMDAERRRSELMLGHSEDAPCPTVGEVWARWALPDLERRRADEDLSVRTLAVYRRAWEADVAPRWESTQCDAVRPLAVQQWLMELTLSQAKRALQLLTLALDYAVRYELVSHNVGREKYLMPSQSTVERRDKGVWTLDELGGVWRVVRERAVWLEPAFLLAAFGGCRVSESLGPFAGEVERMDVGKVPLALVPISRQVTKEEGVTDRLKTERSRRVVIVPGKAALALVSTAKSMPADRPLTHDGSGGFSSRDRLNRAWRRDVLPALPADQRHLFQNLRNSYQTNMRWALGLPPWLVEPLLGHVGEGVTGMHYDRPRVEQFAATVAQAYAEHKFDAGWDFLGLESEAHTS